MSWIKRLFCKHDYRFLRNIWGDEIIACGYKRSLWKCTECGKLDWRENLVPLEIVDLLTNLAQILDVVKREWGEAWSAWDQEQRDRITRWLANHYDESVTEAKETK